MKTKNNVKTIEERQLVHKIERYIDYVYEVNRELIFLCGYDAIIDSFEGVKEIYRFSEDLFKIIACSANENSAKSCERDGLLVYKSYLNDFIDQHKQLVERNENTLISLKILRNKLEHQLDIIEHNATSSGTNLAFEFRFRVNDKNYLINSNKVIDLIVDLNNLYAPLQSFVSTKSKEYDITIKQRRISLDQFNNQYLNKENLRLFSRMIKK